MKLAYVLFRKDGFDYIVDLGRQATEVCESKTDSVFDCEIPWEREGDLNRIRAGGAILVYKVK